MKTYLLFFLGVKIDFFKLKQTLKRCFASKKCTVRHCKINMNVMSYMNNL